MHNACLVMLVSDFSMNMPIYNEHCATSAGTLTTNCNRHQLVDWLNSPLFDRFLDMQSMLCNSSTSSLKSNTELCPLLP